MIDRPRQPLKIGSQPPQAGGRGGHDSLFDDQRGRCQIASV